MSDVVVQASFNSGEWSPALFARVDVQKWRSGAALLENFFVDYRGGASTRPGTRFIGPTVGADSGKVRLIPFQVTAEIGYICVFTDNVISFIYRGAYITEDPFAISAATQADPVVITVVGNDFVIGDLVYVTGVVGMTQLNGRYYLVSNVAGSAVTLTTFFSDDVDSTGYDAYTSGGTVARIYSIISPYAGDDLANIKYAQNFTQMILCNPNFVPYVLTIVSPNNWTIDIIHIGSTATVPDAPTVTTSLGADTVNYSYMVTSVDANGQESNPSDPGTLLNVEDIRIVAGTNNVDFPQAEGAASYNIYKAELSYIGPVPDGATHGYIGYTFSPPFIDSNIAPDFSITPPIEQHPFRAGGSVNSVIIGAPGVYSAVPTATIVGGAVTPATISPFLGVTGTPTVGAGGAGYAALDTITLSNGVVVVVDTVAAGVITAFKAITFAGSNRGLVSSGSTPANPRPQVSTSGGGTGATVNLVWGVTGATITNGGFGYGNIPTVVFSSGAATATVTLSRPDTGNPTVPAFFQQRLVLAATPGQPETFWMSKPGQFFNFDISQPVRADDAITETLSAGVLNTIKSMVPMTSGLLVFTDTAVWMINGGSPGAAVSPTSIVATPQSYIGANNIRPIVANYDILFPQQKGSSIRDLAFNIYFNVFTGSDISILPSHLFFGYQITDWCWAEEPFKVVWAVRNDGILLSCTFMKEQEFTAWAHHTTDGTYLATATVSEPAEDGTGGFVDAPYFAVARTITL